MKMSQIKLENFILGFGIFGIIISMIAAGACLAGYFYLIWPQVWRTVRNDIYVQETEFYIIVAIVTLFLHIAVISMVFSVLLVKGVKTKNPRFLRMYFVYGCLMNLLCAIAVTVYSVVCQTGAEIVAFVLAGCSIYSVILAAVLRTQVKYQILSNKSYQINTQLLILDT